MRDGYTTLDKMYETETVIKGSRFIACASPCSSESDLDSFLDLIRAKYQNATHYCYGATFNSLERFSDNGEPSGTAGRPILQVVKGSGIDDLAIVVVRYFGGTLLGTGGLVQAYSGVSSQVLENAGSIRMVRCARLKFTVTYGEYNVFLSSCSGMANTVDQAFTETVSLTVDVPEKYSSQFAGKMSDITRGKYSPELLMNTYCAER